MVGSLAVDFPSTPSPKPVVFTTGKEENMGSCLEKTLLYGFSK